MVNLMSWACHLGWHNWTLRIVKVRDISCAPIGFIQVCDWCDAKRVM